ncbi:MAG: peptide chain release factor N(5)-glutamine methyltransferase [Chthoniobacterales bacterium]
MKNDDPISLLDALQRGTAFLKKQNIEQARLNMEHLLAHVLGIPRLQLYMEFERPLGETERAPLRDLIRLRGQGTPLQHLLGTTEFFGRVFYCDHRALIPRPETEQLVERALTYKNCGQILDIGTGSGVIAITLALEKNSASVDAIELSADALALAQENAALNNVSSITWHHGDLFSALKEDAKEKKFDLIIANLPYIPTDEILTLSREVKHDPLMALDGGVNGLDLIKLLIEQAPMHLREGGHLLLEIGKNQETEIMNFLQQNNFSDIVALPDYQGVLRFIEGRKSCR